MFLKVVVAAALLAAALSMSGCCSCCSPLSKGDSDHNPQIDDGPTDPGDADNLFGHWIWGQSAYDGSTLAETDIDFYENGTFTFISVFHKYGGGGTSYTIVGRYHVSGDLIKYTHIVKYYYQDMNQPDHTTTNIADTSGTYRIEPGNACDTVYLQAKGLWDNETSYYRYP
ncbi:MAG TPA: hypothetical protein VK436_17005 [Methanocella sp.]|nr:hypothetical protein [Methanocella sp.]